ncbi:hypothetical protein ACFXDJ_30945 [Streptomyces sp. NPDC059443]|uniref:hypothetical protein n=1 Tax=unclassified Streptomyces TaxID=2593676 RepID=UPI0036C00410
MPVPQDQPADQPVGPPANESLTWSQDGETFTLVIEPLDTRPFTRADNAVVYNSDGSRRCRVRPPRELMSNPAAVLGFFRAFPGPDGRPVLVVATRSSGDFQGTLDLGTGTLRSLTTCR